MKIKFLIFLVLCSVFVFPVNVSALTASPVRLELTGERGQLFSSSFDLFNEFRKTQVFTLRLANFESKDETGTPKFVENSQGLPEWIRFENNSITLGPLERKKVSFEVNIPGDADPGGYFASVLASSEADVDLEDGEVGVQSTVGTLILLTVKGEFVEGADILDFQTRDKKKVFRSLPVDFSYRFQNAGDTWAKPLGDIEINNIFGGVAKMIPANPEGSNVLPKSIRRFAVSWLTRKGEVEDQKNNRPPPLPDGFWKRVQHEVEYFALGRYRANLSLTYGSEEQKTATSSLVFWVMPWELLILVFGSMLVLLGLFTAVATFIILKFVRRKQKSA